MYPLPPFILQWAGFSKFPYILLGGGPSHGQFSQPKQNPAVTLEAAILGSYVALSNLVFRDVRQTPA